MTKRGKFLILFLFKPGELFNCGIGKIQQMPILNTIKLNTFVMHIILFKVGKFDPLIYISEL